LNRLNTHHSNQRTSKADYTRAIYKDHESLFNELTERELHTAVTNKSSTASKLARNAPKQHRGEMEKLFNISLFIHKRFEQIHNLPKQDIHGAITIFLYGIWSIYNQGATIPGKQFDTLIKNTRETMRERAEFLKEFEKSTKANQAALYETFAMVGNWLLMIQHHLTSQPNDTALNNIKIMVKEVITRSLKIEPEAIAISQEGELTITHNLTAQ
jgi:hypothetical protein